jgi:2-keto-4-pentenoate hydratase/2-oxohepta-3-ene-1,7-dioic acid hydratase in catechol pathway
MTAPVRWARFRTDDGRIGFGIYTDTQIIEYDGGMFESPRATGVTHECSAVTLMTPCAPTKIVALWNNFRALAAKLGKEPPNHPMFLIKPATSVIGPGEVIRRPTGYVGKIAYEGELGVVIGRRCKDVTVDQARDFIFGYTCVNDVTATDVLNETVDFAQWCRSKGYDSFGVLGPVIATDLDWSEARVVTTLAGTERQNYLLSDIIMSPAELVSRISHDMTLLPGDVIACGTSLGVGSIKDGAEVEVNIPGIGSLINVLR